MTRLSLVRSQDSTIKISSGPESSGKSRRDWFLQSTADLLLNNSFTGAPEEYLLRHQRFLDFLTLLYIYRLNILIPEDSSDIWHIKPNLIFMMVNRHHLWEVSHKNESRVFLIEPPCWTGQDFPYKHSNHWELYLVKKAIYIFFDTFLSWYQDLSSIEMYVHD